jgi:hypothetical protein
MAWTYDQKGPESDADSSPFILLLSVQLISRRN